MDDNLDDLEREQEILLRKLAAFQARIQALGRPNGEVPHYSEIERPAHEIGRRLSQLVQEEAMADQARKADSRAECPDCGRSCPLDFKTRTIQSTDGPVEMREPFGHCPRCQRDFFPSA